MGLLQRFSRQVAFPFWDRREGGIRLAEFERLAKAQWSTSEERQQYQLERLNDMLAYAARAVPYYREEWSSELTEKPLSSVSELTRFPILTKQNIRDHLDTLISDEFRKDQLVTAKTGGSTGVALKLYFDEKCQQLRNAAAMYADSWAGWQPGMRTAALWGSPPIPRTAREKIRNALHDRVFLSGYHATGR